MKKETAQKITENYKNVYLVITAVSVYLFISIFKNLYYSLYGLNPSNFTNIEYKLTTIVYQIFAISISILFYIKHKKDEEKELKDYTKGLIISGATIFIYITSSFFEVIILLLKGINIKDMSIKSKTIYLIICEIIIIILISIINRKKLKKNIIEYKNNWRDYFEKYLKYYIFALIVMIVSNLIINMFTKGISGNQENINNMFEKAPIYILFSSIITAPFLEEMVFRQSIRNIIRSKTTFIIASGLIFGGLHVVGSMNSLIDLLYIIPYSAPGIAFAYMLAKTDNIFVSMGIHFMHNAIFMIPQIIFLLH